MQAECSGKSGPDTTGGIHGKWKMGQESFAIRDEANYGIGREVGEASNCFP